MTGGDGFPPIPRQRSEIVAEAKKCANSRALHQNRLVDELLMIDALSRRLDDLVAALTVTPGG